MSQLQKELYEFSRFRLDVSERLLRRDGKRVSLTDKAFDTLCVLVKHGGELVGKDELMAEVWADAIVEENNLDQKISMLRQALGERGRGKEKFIETVRGHGYRFLPDVRRVEAELEIDSVHSTTLTIPSRTGSNSSIAARPYETKRTGNVLAVAKWRREEIEDTTEAVNDEARTANVAGYSTPKLTARFHRISSTRRAVIYAAVLIILMLGSVGYLWQWRQTSVAPQTEIKSLAVLPLKSLDAGENYLGLGIADAVIRRINQTGKLIVRPTSAVRRYLNEDTDALTAARQLNADAVLEGNVQRADDRLRVSVNLLRTSDGVSLWSDSFDMRSADIFTIQDTVAQQVATRLQLQLDPSQQARLMKRYTSNPVAYEYYLKGVYTFDQRVTGTQRKEATIDFFKQAIEADPNFALAHAQLAYAYAQKAIFIEPTEAVWAERAKEEINRAEALDPQLAETHLARFQLLYGAYEGYQGEAAVRELFLAQQLNPNVGHAELAYLYLHLGLEDLAARELERASEIDPTSEYAKMMTLLMYELGGKFDEYAAHRELYHDAYMDAWYFMGTGRLDGAQKTIDEWSTKRPDDIELPPKKALLFALKGDFRAAEASIPAILSSHPVKDPLYHHAAYDIARIYALEGKSVEAVKWLREANATGFQPYPLFERDAFLNRIRNAPEFIQFMAEMKAQNERYRREFASTQ